MTVRNGVQMHKGAVLTEIDIVEIRDKYWKRNWTQGALARLKGVTVNTIGKIVRGESWQHVGGAGTKAQELADEQDREEAKRVAEAVQAGDTPETLASLARLQAMLNRDREKEHGEGGSEREGAGSVEEGGGTPGGKEGSGGMGG